MDSALLSFTWLKGGAT